MTAPGMLAHPRNCCLGNRPGVRVAGQSLRESQPGRLECATRSPPDESAWRSALYGVLTEGAPSALNQHHAPNQSPIGRTHRCEFAPAVHSIPEPSGRRSPSSGRPARARSLCTIGGLPRASSPARVTDQSVSPVLSFPPAWLTAPSRRLRRTAPPPQHQPRAEYWYPSRSPRVVRL